MLTIENLSRRRCSMTRDTVRSCTCPSRLRNNNFSTVELRWLTHPRQEEYIPAGYSKRPSSKVAASEEAKTYSAVRCASERRENAAGGLFQHPARLRCVTREDRQVCLVCVGEPDRPDTSDQPFLARRSRYLRSYSMEYGPVPTGRIKSQRLQYTRYEKHPLGERN